jgi:hypothetical protein
MSTLGRISNKALKMIKQNGVALVLTRTAPGTVSTAGTPTAGAATTSNTYGAFLPLSSYSDNKEEVNALAQRKIRYLLIAGKGMTLQPQPQDVLAQGSVSWRVESSTPISPNGADIVHQTLVVQL